MLSIVFLLLRAPTVQAAFADDFWTWHADLGFQSMFKPRSDVTSFAQTPDGFLWIGTAANVARWDGYQQRLYTPDPIHPGPLDGGDAVLRVDSKGTLWLGTIAGSLSRYDAKQDRFVSALAEGQRLSAPRIRAITESRDGLLWIGTSAGVDVIDTHTGQVRRHADHAGRRGLPAGTARSVLADSSGRVWVTVDGRGLYRWSPGSEAFESIALPFAIDAGTLLIAELEDSEGNVWVASLKHGVFVFDASSDKPIALDRFARGLSGPVADEPANSMLEAADGEVWVFRASSMTRIDIRKREARVIRPIDQAPNRMPNDVSAAFKDSSGAIWVGTGNADAVYRVAPPGAFSTWLGAPHRDDGIRARKVDHVLALGNGEVWLSDGGATLNLLQPATGGIRQVTTGLASGPGVGITRLAASSSGEVFAGTRKGLYRLDSAQSSLSRAMVPGRKPALDVLDLALFEQRLWLRGPDGLWVVESQRDGRTKVLAAPAADAATGVDLSVMLPTGDRTTWLGTRSGLMRLTMSDDPGADGTLPISREFVLPGFVSQMLKDDRGRLWVAMQGAGLRILDPKAAGQHQSAQAITTVNGLPSDGVTSMVMDRLGHVWLGTDSGLVRVNKDTLAVRAYDEADGLAVLTYSIGSSAAATADGRLVFGGAGGMTVVNPEQVSPWVFEAPIVLTEIRAGDEPVRYNHVPSDDPLVLKPNARNLLVEFAALDLSAPERNLYEYRLRGLDSEWTSTPATRRVASFSHLPAGDYVLELRGSNREGRWSKTMQLPVRVIPAWHEMSWFRAAMVVLGAGTMFLVVHARTVYLRRRQRELQLLVQERTAALQERTEQLQQSQRQLEEIAFLDSLTGLANRRLFNDEFRRLIAMRQRHGGGFSLLLLDLDLFKPINDLHGHDVGDKVLVTVAGRLKSSIRETDIVARLGGDEFGLLLSDATDEAAVGATCTRIASAFAEPVLHGSLQLHVRASIGAAIYPIDGTDVDALFKAADVALYREKRKRAARGDTVPRTRG